MGWYTKLYGKAGPGISKEEPSPRGLRLLLFTFAREWKNLVKINLLFLLFCLPVVTIPAAICAMQHITLNMIQDEPVLLWTDFYRAFQQSLKRGTLFGWLYLLFGAALVICLSVYAQFELYHGFFLIPYAISVLLAFLFLLTGTYFFPLIVRSDMGGLSLVRNALLMSFAYFPHGFSALLANVVLSLLCDLFFPIAWPMVVLLLFSLQSLISAFVAWSDLCSQLRRSGETPSADHRSGE